MAIQSELSRAPKTVIMTRSGRIKTGLGTGILKTAEMWIMMDRMESKSRIAMKTVTKIVMKRVMKNLILIVFLIQILQQSNQIREYFI